MIYRGKLTGVSAIRQVQSSNGETLSFCTIVVENPSLSDERVGMTMEVNGELARRCKELFDEASSCGSYAVVEVQFKPVVRTWKDQNGQERIFQENRVITVAKTV